MFLNDNYELIKLVKVFFLNVNKLTHTHLLKLMRNIHFNLRGKKKKQKMYTCSFLFFIFLLFLKPH